MYVCMYARVFEGMYVRMYVCMYVCMHVCIPEKARITPRDNFCITRYYKGAGGIHHSRESHHEASRRDLVALWYAFSGGLEIKFWRVSPLFLAEGQHLACLEASGATFGPS